MVSETVVHRAGRGLLSVLLTLTATHSLAQPAPNVRLNSDGTTNIHNEEQLAVRPTDPNTVVAAWRDFRLGFRRIGVGTSHDKGQTWTDRLLPAVRYEWASDPGICADRNGNFYLHVLGVRPGSGAAGGAIQVFKSTDGGDTWSAPVDAVTSPFGLLDKQMIACDRTTGSTSGNVYLAFFDLSAGIRLTRSTNGGTTWSTPRQVSGGGSVQWPVPAIGATGQVYVGWVDFTAAALKFDRSTDGGVTFGADRTITNLLVTNEPLNGAIDVLAYPAMMADITNGPRRGTIYVAYIDRSQPGGDTDIFLRRSADQGDTWSAPVRVNDDLLGNGRDQFHPWIAVDEQGIVNLVWLDRRDDLQNLKWHVYVARSFDGGITFTPNVRISTVASNPAAGQTVAAGTIGEYIGLDALGGDLYSVWTDTRAGQQDVWGATIVALDSDGDGARDTTDNCPVLANRLQRDGDGDGLGNECDSDADGDSIANASDTDDDNDGALDVQDCAATDKLVFARPGESPVLASSPNKQSWTWSADLSGSATSYRLDRGTIPASGFSGFDHRCVVRDLATPTAGDSLLPASGQSHYYLGLLENCFGAGDAGTTSSGPRPTGPCP